MQILVVGSEASAQEVKKKFGNAHLYRLAPDHVPARAALAGSEIVFDFLLADDPSQQLIYRSFSGPVFVHCVLTTLSAILDNPTALVFGCNGWPGGIDRPELEVSLNHTGHRGVLSTICMQLATDYRVVDDRVGLVTPRIVSMIINEAYFTVQEGTASASDIDRAMQLGTNYPAGPFAWCAQIGVRQVYRLLEALYQDTHDERYKVAPLLKKEYLRSQKQQIQ